MFHRSSSRSLRKLRDGARRRYASSGRRFRPPRKPPENIYWLSYTRRSARIACHLALYYVGCCRVPIYLKNALHHREAVTSAYTHHAPLAYSKIMPITNDYVDLTHFINSSPRPITLRIWSIHCFLYFIRAFVGIFHKKKSDRWPLKQKNKRV